MSLGTKSLGCLLLLALTTGNFACRREEQQPLPARAHPQSDAQSAFQLGSCTEHPALGWCQTVATGLSTRDGAAELLRAAAQDVLAQHCAECHSSLAPQAAVPPLAIDDPRELVRSGMVVPLSSTASPLLQRVQRGEMPPASRAPLSAQEIELLALWIDTPRFWPDAMPACEPSAAPSFELLLSTVAADLALSPESDRPFQRYLSLAHRAGTECNPGQLELERQALSKGLNMLSLNGVLHVPVAIDAARTLYRIDLRHFDWARPLTIGAHRFADVWEAIAGNSPYAVSLTGTAAELARSAAGTAFPLLLADHVLDAALSGRLYQAILDVDSSKTLFDLIEDDFAVDEDLAFFEGQLLRAVTTRSRSSTDTRVVQRHEMGNRPGALWQVLESRTNGATSLFDDPLDPVNGERQVMFTLPNGLFGFLSSNASGLLLDSGAVAVDELGFLLPAPVMTCSACHAAGLLPVQDEMRPFVLLVGKEFLDRSTLEQVEQIYVEPEQLERALQRDFDDFYGKALRQLELPSSGRDPVAAAALRFGAPLTLRDAAAELSVSEELLRSRLAELPWLAPLAQGTLRRDDFAPLYVASLCVLAGGSTPRPNDVACERALGALR